MAEEVVWKEIAGFKNYEVSNDGRIRNKKKGMLKKPTPDKDGYYTVSLN